MKSNVIYCSEKKHLNKKNKVWAKYLMKIYLKLSIQIQYIENR